MAPVSGQILAMAASLFLGFRCEMFLERKGLHPYHIALPGWLSFSAGGKTVGLLMRAPHRLESADGPSLRDFRDLPPLSRKPRMVDAQHCNCARSHNAEWKVRIQPQLKRFRVIGQSS
jgi:hypothetical protein